MANGNLFADASAPASGERFETLLRHRNLLVERIVSSALVTGTHYVQPQDEWVLLLNGAARLQVAGATVLLGDGDYLFLPAGTPHAVEQVSAGAIWLAVHLYQEAAATPD